MTVFEMLAIRIYFRFALRGLYICFDGMDHPFPWSSGNFDQASFKSMQSWRLRTGESAAFEGLRPMPAKYADGVWIRGHAVTHSPGLGLPLLPRMPEIGKSNLSAGTKSGKRSSVIEQWNGLIAQSGMCQQKEDVAWLCFYFKSKMQIHLALK